LAQRNIVPVKKIETNREVEQNSAIFKTNQNYQNYSELLERVRIIKTCTDLPNAAIVCFTLLTASLTNQYIQKQRVKTLSQEPQSKNS